jgi:hypothetical protein
MRKLSFEEKVVAVGVVVAVYADHWTAIALVGVVIAAVGVYLAFVSHFLPKKKTAGGDA